MESLVNIKRARESYLYSSNGFITGVNDEFVNLTGFTMSELIGKSISEIGSMIKFNLQLDNNNNSYSGFIFTKFMEAREVNISLFYDKEKNKQKYIFVEKLNSRFDEKFIFVEQMCNEDISSVAIYSVPDLTLLKASKSYINLMNPPFNRYENIIGKSIREIISGIMRRKIDFCLESIYKSKKTVYMKELKLRNITYGKGYWDFTITPIFEERESIKYVVVTSMEVTDRVLKNRSLERQKRIIEKQKAELEERNLQLRAILENLSEGIILSDNEGKIMMVNKEAKRLIYQGDKFNYLYNTNAHTKFFNMDGKETNIEKILRAKALKGKAIKNDRIMVSKYGKEYYIDNSCIPIYDEGGNVNMIVSCFHDITETILQSKKIQEQKEELNAIIENITEGIAIFDSERKYKLFNKAAREMFYNSQEYLDQEPEVYNSNGEKISSQDYPSGRIIQGEKIKNMNLVVKYPNKELRIDVSGTPIYSENGEFLIGIACFKDVTSYYEQEKILRNRNEFLNRLIYNLEIPVIGLSCNELEILKINQKALNIIKSTRPEVKVQGKFKGKKITDIIPDFKEGKCFKKISEVIKEGKTKYLKKSKVISDGNEAYYRYIFEPIFEISGGLKEILILGVDITAEVKSNMVMEKTLKLQEEFLANISHELKTPLNVIFATVQLINMYFNNNSLEEKKECIIKYIDSIKQNSYRLSKLINNIVDLSKIEAGFFELKLSNKNIVEVVEEIVMSVTDIIEVKGLNIIFDTNTEEKVIACDSEKIERIILNLLSNAIKFSNKGDEIFIEIDDKGEFVEVSVKDNGIGIEPGDLDKIFDRFKQVDKSLSRNSEGTGIGLSLVKSFVELHGGSIKVESKFGEGSKFVVNLPSRKVLENNILYESNIRNTSEIIKVEFSDVYS